VGGLRTSLDDEGSDAVSVWVAPWDGLEKGSLS
jgi:hypothetical protein